MSGIDIYRRDIKLELRTYLFQIKHTDSAHTLGGNHVEMDPFPSTPLFFLENKFMILNDDFSHGMDWIDENFKING